MHEQLLRTDDGHVNRYEQSGGQFLSKTLKIIGFDSTKWFLIKIPKVIKWGYWQQFNDKVVYHIII